MALHINLLHDEQLKELERRRDPLKLGVYAIIGILVILAGIFAALQARQATLAKEADTLQRQWEIKEPQLNQAELDNLVFTEKIQTAKDLKAKSDNRFLFGPFLESVLKAIPVNISLDSLSCTVTAATETRGDEIISGHNLQISIVGVSAGEEPRQIAEDFRIGVRDRLEARYQNVEAEFTELEDSNNQVALNGQVLRTANFSMRIVFFFATPSTTGS